MERKINNNLEKYIISLIFLISSIVSLGTSRGSLYFKHFSVKDGLSQSTVRAITQDKQGNLWFGTQNGLSRYDSYTFTTFQSNSSDSTGITDNSIYSLYLDTRGTLWIGTASGLSKFNPKDQTFSNYFIDGQRNTIYSIAEDAGKLLLTSDNGLITFDIKSLKFEKRRLFSGHHLRAICISGKRILAGTDKGLFIRDDNGVRQIASFKNHSISSIVKARGGDGFWIGTNGQGLFRTDKDLGKIKQFSTQSSNKLISDYIRVMTIDNRGLLWIGTYDGLAIYDSQTDTFAEYRHDYEPSSLSHNSIWSIFIDSQDGVWIGTYFGGLNYYNKFSEMFSLIRLKGKTGKETYGFVSYLATDSRDASIWIGTNDDGLFRYNPETKGIERYFSANLYRQGNGHISDNIKCISEEGKNGLYIGTHLGGLMYMDIPSKRVEIYNINEKYPINNGCYSILDDGNGILWTGSNAGLYTFDKKTKKFSKHKFTLQEPRLDNRLISCLFKDSRGKIWIGTNAGLFLSDSTQSSICSFEGKDGLGFTDIYINSVLEINNHIWIGTNKGLFRYSIKGNKFRKFNISDGLPSDNVYSIMNEDGSKLIWLSTGQGVCSFNPKTGTFKNYNNLYGSANEFTTGSACKGKDGTIYFGGLKGVTNFYPSNVTENPYSPTPFISDISAFYKQIEPSGKYEITRDECGIPKKAKISSANNILNIKFAVCNPLSNGKNTFYYFLEGFDKQWYETSGQEVSYSNLTPGKYIFRLKAANNDGKISKGEANVPITVLPRWYQSIVTKLILAALFLLLVFYIIHFRTKRIGMKLQLEMERNEKERIARMGQERINFFISLSHGLRTPLTLILSPLNEIEEYRPTDEYIKKRLGFIRRSAMKLMHTVNQMLGYRKAELGLSKLNLRYEDPDAIAGDCFSLFEEEAVKREMDYIIDSNLSGRTFPIDVNVVEVILMNLLNNAFKFTPKGGLIKLSLKQEANYISISVYDTGIGISADKIEHIFDLFYQVDESRSGTGIGLAIVKKLAELHHGSVSAKSEPGKFTLITVKLPASKEEYTDSEWATGEKVSNNSELVNMPYFLADAASPEEFDFSDEEQKEIKNTLLLAIEDADFRKYIAESFHSTYNVYSVDDGNKALEMIREKEPDVVIADQNLPGMSGIKLCLDIKRNIQTCHIPVIILGTGDAATEERTNIEAGADDYISKPFSVRLIQAKVTNILKTRDRLRHHYSAHTEIEPEKITSNAIDGEFLRKAMEVVENNIDNETFSSNDFAEAMCMSRSNLYLKITSITGESAAKFIRKIRFNKACNLLLENKYSISEISTKVGFSSPSYFATSFKKYVGCLPTEYLKNYKKQE